jgi:hypothetical protein
MTNWIETMLSSQERIIDDDSKVLGSVVSVFTGAGMSALTATVLFHLAASQILQFDEWLELLGRIFIPGSQGNPPLSSGYLGMYGGIFASYVGVLLGWFIIDVRIPGVNIRNLPTVILICCVLNATLAWSLFFPWIPIE